MFKKKLATSYYNRDLYEIIKHQIKIYTSLKYSLYINKNKYVIKYT